MKKKIITAVLAIIAILVLGGLLLGSNLDAIIKAAVEKYGTEATQAETKLAKVALSLKDGKASLQGFTLANPEGYSSETAMSFSEIAVEIEPKSLMGDGPIKIRRILIEQPEILYEVNEDGSSNLQTFQKNIAEFSSQVNKEMAKQAAEGKKETADKERKLVIEEIALRGGKLKIKHALLKDGDLANIHLPPIHMFNIGHGDRGVTPAMVAQRVLGQIVSESVMTGQATAMRELTQRGLDAASKAKAAAEAAAKEAAKSVKGSIGNAVGNLLGE